MQANPRPCSECGRDQGSTRDRSTIYEEAVMGLLLEEGLLTLPELVLALCKPAGSFSERDGIERAVRDLVGAGLLRFEGDSLLPTRTALRFSTLECGC